jgi:hypothetical protein
MRYSIQVFQYGGWQAACRLDDQRNEVLNGSLQLIASQ